LPSQYIAVSGIRPTGNEINAGTGATVFTFELLEG
jgi:hypothetical protein